MGTCTGTGRDSIRFLPTTCTQKKRKLKINGVKSPVNETNKQTSVKRIAQSTVMEALLACRVPNLQNDIYVAEIRQDAKHTKQTSNLFKKIDR
jgi:hypothetical protein